MLLRIKTKIYKFKFHQLYDIQTFNFKTKKHNLYNKIWQAYAALLPVKTVGVMGDNRTYEYVCLLLCMLELSSRFQFFMLVLESRQHIYSILIIKKSVCPIETCWFLNIYLDIIVFVLLPWILKKGTPRTIMYFTFQSVCMYVAPILWS